MSILLTEERDGTLLLTLNRPEVHNALSGDLAEALAAHLSDAARRSDVQVIVITGAGERAFCAGTDLKERRDFTAEQKWEQRCKGWRVNEILWRQPQAVIAAIHGWCFGGGLELALFCDLRLATEEAVFAFPELGLGSMPGSGGPILLPRLVGAARAKELLFTRRRISATEAREYGMAGRVVAKGELLPQALALAEEIKGSAPLSVKAVKQLIDLGHELTFEAAVRLSEALHRPLGETKDAEEGLKAFFEKRKPVFRGE